jgi:hypothetical protein
MLDLITTTEEVHYENYRQQQMETRKWGEPKVKKHDNPKFKEEEETLRKRFTEQVKMEESRFRQWEQHLIAERDRLNKDLESAHSCVVEACGRRGTTLTSHTGKSRASKASSTSCRTAATSPARDRSARAAERVTDLGRTDCASKWLRHRR